MPPAATASTPSASFSSSFSSVRTAIWSSSKPTLPSRCSAMRAEPVAGDGDRLPALDLGGGALGVAEVGEEEAHAGAADTGAVGAGEAGQVLDVGQVGDQQPVQLALGEQGLEAVAAAAHQAVVGAELAGQQLQRLAVAVGALAADLRQHQAVEDRVAAPLVAVLDVGEVDLDRGQAGDVERVGDRAAVVSPGAGVDDRRVGEVGQAVQVLDELALVVGLEEDRFEPELVRPVGDPLLQLAQREAAVDLRVATVEDVEVDAVEDGDAVAGGGHP